MAGASLRCLLGLACMLCLPGIANGGGIVARYDFSEGDGNVLRDTSGNGNHGAIHGADWVRVGDEYALKFNGRDDYVDCGTGKSLNLRGPFSIEAWVYPEELPHGEALLLGRDFGSYVLTYSGSTYPARVYCHVARLAGKSRARAPARLWHHVVATVDGKLIRIYVDGALAGGVRVWKQSPKGADKTFRIGGGLPGFAHFKGMLNEVRVYDYALPWHEVFQHYRDRRSQHPNELPPRIPATAGKSATRLNNLVTELLRVANPPARARLQYEFETARDGWIFISTRAKVGKNAAVRVLLGGKPNAKCVIVHDKPSDLPMETMRRLPAGRHTLDIRCRGGAALKQLVVRAIPRLIYATMNPTPKVPEFGTYSRDFLEADVLRNVNTLVGVPKKRSEKAGKEWIIEETAPWYNYATRKTSRTVEDFCNLLTSKAGFKNPLLDGVLFDTHDVGNFERYDQYTEAVRRVHDNKESRRKLYFYCDCLYGARRSEAFARTVLDSGYELMWTRYLHEQPTEEAAQSFLEARLVNEAVGWRDALPGSIERMTMALGYLTSPGQRMNIEPGVNYFVYMDMQCNLLANHPAFQGLRGVMWYKSHYAEEEAVRWAGRLFRHYFIEGRTEMLSRDPYELHHLHNPDFNQGTAGWTLAPAEAGTITAKNLPRYGFLQGRWLETGAGNNFLWMRRSAAGPNRFSQHVRNLQPGRLYSLKMYTADYRDILQGKSDPRKHTVSIHLDHADLVPEKCFQHVYHNFPSRHLGPYHDKPSGIKTWLNFHRQVFRAKSTSAKLTVSDWLGPEDPGGPIAAELMYNFIEVQPYVE